MSIEDNVKGKKIKSIKPIEYISDHICREIRIHLDDGSYIEITSLGYGCDHEPMIEYFEKEAK